MVNLNQLCLLTSTSQTRVIRLAMYLLHFGRRKLNERSTERAGAQRRLRSETDLSGKAGLSNRSFPH